MIMQSPMALDCSPLVQEFPVNIMDSMCSRLSRWAGALSFVGALSGVAYLLLF
jgi:hypothetical protein